MYPNNYTNYIADRAVDNDENQDRRQEAETELAAALIVQQDHHIELTDPSVQAQAELDCEPDC